MILTVDIFSRLSDVVFLVIGFEIIFDAATEHIGDFFADSLVEKYFLYILGDDTEVGFELCDVVGHDGLEGDFDEFDGGTLGELIFYVD